nr:DUF4011 domain-containing protein [uncultured Sphaerochaeta sp.]
MDEQLDMEETIGPEFEIQLTPGTNFCYSQFRSKIPLFLHYRVKNNAEDKVTNLQIRISLTECFESVSDIHLKTLGKCSSYSSEVKGSIELKLKPNEIRSLTEEIEGRCYARLMTSDGIILETRISEYTVQPFNQWSGIAKELPIFITPNSQEVLDLVACARKFLLKATGRDNFDAYQSADKSKVIDQIAAVFEAVASQHIGYIEMLPSFSEGQRIRLSDEIISQKSANCLDMSLLFTSVLEAIGLRPVVIITNSHAYIGVRLSKSCDYFVFSSDSSNLSLATLGNDQDMILIEPTMANGEKPASFLEAKNKGTENLETLDFNYYVDIAFARLDGILPFPIKQISENGEIIYVEPETVNTSFANIYDEPVDITAELIEVEDQKDKIGLWSNKLLELTTRNPLLAMRLASKTFQVLAPDLNKLENLLMAGNEFSLTHKRISAPITDYRCTEIRQHAEIFTQMIESVNHLLPLDASEKDLKKKLSTIYLQSRKDLAEGGINTLYLVIGHIEWFEEDKDIVRHAPMLLYPVTLIKKGSNDYRIMIRDDEEPQINITFFEMMSIFYKKSPGFDIYSLPSDESGLDIAKIFALVQNAIRDIPNWDCQKTCYLGLFSFGQMVMWKDLKDRATKLKENKVVSALINSKVFNEKTLPEIDDYDFYKLKTPLTCDETQLKAIKASSGATRSFILQGPPGTGKSQTITSIIVNALLEGKRVLFVAEKMAALKVVYRNLSKANLSQFLLELHSNKASKSSLIEQLDQAMNREHCQTIQDSISLDVLDTNTKYLSAYYAGLHRINLNGMSLYQMIDEYFKIKDTNYKNLSSIVLDFDKIAFLTKEDLKAIEIGFETLYFSAKEFQPIKTSFIGKFEFDKWDEEIQQSTTKSIDELNVINDTVNRTFSLIRDFLACSNLQPSYEISLSLNELCKIVQTIQAEQIPQELIRKESTELSLMMQKVAGLFKKREAILQKIKESWIPTILKENIQRMIFDYDNLSGIFKRKLRKRLLDKINSFRIIPLDQSNVPVSLRSLLLPQSELLDIDNELLNLGADDPILSLRLRNIEDCKSIMNLKTLYDEALFKASSVLCKHSESYDITVFMKNLSESAWSMTFAEATNHFFINAGAFEAEWGKIVAILKFQGDVSVFKDRIDFIKKVEAMFSVFSRWAKFRMEANQFKYRDSLPEAYDLFLSNVPFETMFKSLQLSYYMTYINKLISKVDAFRIYNNAEFDNKLRLLKKTDNDYNEILKENIPNRLSEIWDKKIDREARYNIGKYCTSKGKKVSIRKFFESYSSAITSLCPCCLMSPLSIAQYLDPSTEKFDLVVFDEASQIPTCKAVGAIARGKETIIVGDQMQMPPTSFFGKSTTTDDYDIDEMDDLDNILEDCSVLEMPETLLRWHYRSNHESLISFSNRKYYKGNLLSYPSVDSNVPHVHMRYISSGYYSSGENVPNQFEVTAIRKEVRKRLSDPVLREESIGIITFNEKQQRAIYNELDSFFQKNPELAKYAYWGDDEVSNPKTLIVKNLENVQGDERDIIMFSITFAQNKVGRLNLNFGPISKPGGEKRLNVAFSRARKEMIIFTCMNLGTFRSKPLSSRGAKDLLAFLEYAEGSANPSIGRGRSLNEYHILGKLKEALEADGWEAEENIGLSKYKIALGVRAKNDTTYFAGIILDFTSILKTSKDRDLLQISQLERVGWTPILFKSLSWWKNPESVKDEIISKVHEAYTRYLEKEKVKTQIIQNEYSDKAKVDFDDSFAKISKESYISITLAINNLIKISDFGSDKMLPAINFKIDNLIDQEGPILDDWLEKKLVYSFGIKKRGGIIQEKLNAIMTTRNDIFTIQSDIYGFEHKVYWPPEYDSVDKRLDYSKFRVYDNASSVESKRDIKDIPEAEIQNCMRYLLLKNGEMMFSELCNGAAEEFGYKRQGQAIKETMKKVLEALVRDAFFVQEAGIIRDQSDSVEPLDETPSVDEVYST